MMHLKKMMSRCRETWIKATHSMWTRTDFLEYVFFFCLDCVTLSQHMKRQEAVGSRKVARGLEVESRGGGGGARAHTHTLPVRAQRAGIAARAIGKSCVISASRDAEKALFRAPLPAHCEGSVRENTVCVLLFECVVCYRIII
jgi:hypothetical protein